MKKWECDHVVSAYLSLLPLPPREVRNVQEHMIYLKFSEILFVAS